VGAAWHDEQSAATGWALARSPPFSAEECGPWQEEQSAPATGYPPCAFAMAPASEWQRAQTSFGALVRRRAWSLPCGSWQVRHSCRAGA
jgi:hypothetical protein